jgi:hypothetical protein
MDASLLAELQALIARHSLPKGEALAALPNVRLSTVVAPTPPLAHVAEPIFALVAQGTKCVALGNKDFDYGTGQYLIVSVDLPVDAHVVEATAKTPYLGFGFTLRPEAIAALLLETGMAQPAQGDPPGIAVSSLTNDLVDPVVRLLRLLDRSADIPVLASAIEREILWRLINGQQGAMVQQIGLADSRTAQIARAIRWVRGHYAEAIRIEELALIAGMSVTSFHRHFRGTQKGKPVKDTGMMAFALQKTAAGWRITALSWATLTSNALP